MTPEEFVETAPPECVEMNAWTGAPGGEPLGPGWKAWVAREGPPPWKPLAAREADARDWTHPEVGWGLVLPEGKLPPARRATADDAPPPIRDLFAKRAARMGAPVLRYAPDLGNRFLRRYNANGKFEPLDINGTDPGVGPGQLPAYLLLAGSPKDIPWEFQYTLNLSRCVGRLDLPEAGLWNYVKALQSDWAGSVCRRDRPVIWATDGGANDITQVMRRALADPLRATFADDPEVRSAGGKLTYLAGAAATWANLVGALQSQAPALIVTTSHGQTEPLDRPEELSRTLGVPVDAGHRTIVPEELARQWAPNGAIWYAHACCSAGSDATNHYQGLFAAGGQYARLLEELARPPGRSAPLPVCLLGHPSPLRAFIGHVHPTMDWPLRQPQTQQLIAGTIRRALYQGLYHERPKPAALALRPCYHQVGVWYDEVLAALENIDAAMALARVIALRAKLCAYDRRAMVVLGDPTVCLPAPTGVGATPSPQ
jgi:hypothetical protein